MSTFNGYPVATNGYVDTDSVRDIGAEYVDTDSIFANKNPEHKEPDLHFTDNERAKFNWLVNMRHYSVEEAIRVIVEEKRQPEYMTIRNMHEFM